MTAALRLPFLLLGALLLWAAPAGAGTYDVFSCSAKGGNANHVWQLHATGKAVAFDGCPSASILDSKAWALSGNTGLTLRNAVASRGTSSPGSAAWITAQAPEGTRFLRWSGQYLSRATQGWQLGLFSESTRVWDFDCSDLFDSQDPNTGEVIRTYHGCGDWKINPSDPDAYNSELEPSILLGGAPGLSGGPGGAASVTIKLWCSWSGGCPLDTRGATSWTNNYARLNLYESYLQVEDFRPPQLGAVSGPLTDGPGQWHGGTVYADVSASDNTGVQSLSLQQDGEDLATLPGACDYSRLTPCDRQLSGRLTLDTATLEDGEYQFDVVAADSGTEETANLATQSFTLRVDNHAPDAPEDPLQSNQVSETLMAWNMPEDGGAPITRGWYSIGEQPGPGQPLAQLSTLRVPRTGVDQTVWVWLEDALGHSDPARSASFEVPAITTEARATQVGRRHRPRRPRPSQDSRPRPNLAFGRWSSRAVRTCVTWSDGRQRPGIGLQAQVQRPGRAWRVLRAQRPHGGCADIRLPRAYRRHGVLQVGFPARAGLRGISSSYRY